MNIFELVFRVVITIAVMIIMARINGPKQIAQMSFYDYVSGITVGSIASTICINADVPFYIGIIAIILFLAVSLLLNKLTQYNLTANKILTGEPITLIEKGVINIRGLRKSKMTISELLSNLRYSGYFNIHDVYTAILEPTGKISVQPKGFARKIRKDDLESKTNQPMNVVSVIQNGIILHNNLSNMKKDETWLKQELHKQDIDVDLKSIILAILDENGKLIIYKKEYEV